MGGTGSFQALFKVAYVSPFVTSLFGLPNHVAPSRVGLVHHFRQCFCERWLDGPRWLGAGGVTFQTPTVPEPGTLALMGTGILGMAGMIRRRMS